MVLKVMSHRGDHEAVLENDVAEMVFNKMTGKTIEPLRKEIIPDTWHELNQLFQTGKLGYMPVNKDLEILKEFDNSQEQIVFVPPHTGG